MQQGSASKRKTTQLRHLLEAKSCDFLMEAHNGLSAKIVQETGFKGIWASGLSMSAAMGVRDNNEASWTQVLACVETMADATDIPILLDGDTGFGNFNNVRRLINKMEQYAIAGLCIEDKIFPKSNSFINSKTQPLENIDVFCGKIKAAKDSQCDDDFVVVARTEAFIAGHGLNEALKRAEAYRQAGADAVLVHSAQATPIDIEQFMAQWQNRHPVVIVPTRYYQTPAERFRALQISCVIWANHNMRASLLAMQSVCQTLFNTSCLASIENEVAPLSDVFRLQNVDELLAAEKKYLPEHRSQQQPVEAPHA